VKVTQELMRHANNKCTLNVYAQARSDTKREAQQPMVKMILTEESSEILLWRRGPDVVLLRKLGSGGIEPPTIAF
jgi:hypothetical protein